MVGTAAVAVATRRAAWGLLAGLAASLTGCSRGGVARPRPSDAGPTLRRYLANQRPRQGGVTARSVAEDAIAFYRDVLFDGLTAEQAADMLLFQWGEYDFGTGLTFRFDITRQFISAGSSGDDAISQLRYIAHFESTEALRSLKAGNRWCKSRSELPDFELYVLRSDALSAVESLMPLRIEIGWSKV